MQYAYGVPLSQPYNVEFSTAKALCEVARAAENVGFDALYVTEHPIPSQRWLDSGGHDALDPFVALAAVAYATSTLKLLTNLTVIPYRNPFLLAKASATLDNLSSGRLILGAGVGYLKSEFRALGVEYESRNHRFDEYLAALKLAWRGEPFDFDGQFVQAHGVTARPSVVQDPHPSIWLGGNSRLTLRRVAEHAQGWMPMPDGNIELSKDLDRVSRSLTYLRDHARSVGRSQHFDVLSVLREPWRAVQNVRHDIDMHHTHGVTWLAVNGAGSTVSEAVNYLERFGKSVIGEG
jgi:probable F420-dependent oxidoreductase